MVQDHAASELHEGLEDRAQPLPESAARHGLDRPEGDVTPAKASGELPHFRAEVGHFRDILPTDRIPAVCKKARVYRVIQRFPDNPLRIGRNAPDSLKDC